MRFPAPYQPAGTRTRTNFNGGRSTTGGSTRGTASPSADTGRTVTSPSSSSRRSIDAYRGRGVLSTEAPTRATGTDRTPAGGNAGRTTSSGRGALSGAQTPTGAGSRGEAPRGQGKSGKTRTADAGDVRYGAGPMGRLSQPRDVASPNTSGARTGRSGKSGKARGASDDVSSVSERVRRDIDGARGQDTDRPGTSDRVYGAGRAIDRVQQGALRAGVGSVGGIYRSPYRGSGYGNSGGYYNGYGSSYGYGYCGWSWSWGCGWGWGWNSWWGPCNSYWWPWYVGCWYPIWYGGYRPYYWGGAAPAYYSSVVYRTVYVDETYAEEEPVQEAARTPVPNSLSIAADRYLTLGDRAFREGRYTDAVQFYAKAVEYAPGEGAMYLVLSDALFAAGDYHYAAYSIRRALELDPSLATSAVDKHDFYPTPEEFDRQIALLETYLVEHPTDRDARLVLALNYLFGNRPAASVDLLNSSESDSLRGDAAANLILRSARDLQFGQPTPVAPGTPATPGQQN